MQDLTQYSSQELVLHFENNETLYNILQRAARVNDFSQVREAAEENFIYDNEQLEALEEHFNDEVREYDEPVEE